MSFIGIHFLCLIYMISSTLSEFKCSKDNLPSFNIVPNMIAYDFQIYFIAKGIHSIFSIHINYMESFIWSTCTNFTQVFFLCYFYVIIYSLFKNPYKLLTLSFEKGMFRSDILDRAWCGPTCRPTPFDSPLDVESDFLLSNHFLIHDSWYSKVNQSFGMFFS